MGEAGKCYCEVIGISSSEKVGTGEVHMNSKIEQGIEDIYAFIESCKMQSFSTTKVVVPKNDLYDLLDDLRREVPAELQRYRKMLNQKNAILEDAHKKAGDIMRAAQEQYGAMLEEHELVKAAQEQASLMVQEAQEQAAAILDAANAQANEIANGAIYYTADMLDATEKILAGAYDSAMNNAKALEVALGGHLNIVRKNRAELGVPVEQEPVKEQAAPTAEQEAPAAAREDKKGK